MSSASGMILGIFTIIIIRITIIICYFIIITPQKERRTMKNPPSSLAALRLAKPNPSAWVEALELVASSESYGNPQKKIEKWRITISEWEFTFLSFWGLLYPVFKFQKKVKKFVEIMMIMHVL